MNGTYSAANGSARKTPRTAEPNGALRFVVNLQVMLHPVAPDAERLAERTHAADERVST